ncbi:hypothetical protein LUZ63_014641 [Rhynchospora breviuscula]|uniref:Galectin domain-containing protein n=1 Tax=Rhynchospora breviuscula TaxID=2022672 RepID=A0A9Q0CAT8_9POAL|nr:hypothetical protein LUZ63_014641 [Rhynchospora breviuscula]
MKRAKSSDSLSARRWRPAKFLLIAVVVYLVFISFKLFLFFSDDASPQSVQSRLIRHDQSDQTLNVELDQDEKVSEKEDLSIIQNPTRRPDGYGRITGEILRRYAQARSRSQSWTRTGNFSELERVAQEAWVLGHKAWDEAVNYSNNGESGSAVDPDPEKVESCPTSVGLNKGGGEGKDGERIVLLPCGLAFGSSITIIGTPHDGHEEFVPQLAKIRDGNGTVIVSQFIVEFQGLKAVDGEDPPKILHLNPRLKGDWSERPILEHNTCYRMSWGKAMRCDGLSSRDTEETVDGFQKCERWVHAGGTDKADESKTTSWLNRFIGRAKKPTMTWPFPFAEGRMFVLTIQAGVEGYHVSVGGRHISSFPYRTGFTLEDATGLAIKGDVDIHSVFATSLPRTHPSFSPQQVLEMTDKWQARPLPKEPAQLFIGILSATNHFAERMAIRKTWMQYPAIQLGNAVARFFVALSPRKEVNAAMKKEAEYFGDIVILPFLDRYDLVVLKTFAICEYGVQNITSGYIMKCDDDTFVRVDVVLKEISVMGQNKPIYMGNLNLLHRPLRNGKWAVTYEEWPEELYPPYANGPGYIISYDIAKYIVSQHTDHRLRLFKMEDVSMGMWVEEFNSTSLPPVEYLHSWKFCQYGCVENYYTAHYQSPRQMICLYDNLLQGRAQCCSYR